MIKVDQTRMHDPEAGVIGNCWRAVVASLLECKIDDMPAFEEVGDHKEMMRQARRWLVGRGLVLMGQKPHRVFPGFHMACGPCDRWDPEDAIHCCVYLGRKMVHDPNPARTGLTEVWERRIVVPLNPGVVGINSTGLQSMVTLLQSIANGKEPG